MISFGADYERWLLASGRGPRRVKYSDFEQPWFDERMKELNGVRRIHRKLWEHCSIAQAIVDRVRTQGCTAIGFGVGREPIPAWLASRGAMVLATDRPEAGLWLERQYAGQLSDLERDGICDERTFKLNVEYEHVDMNDIPEKLKQGKFDVAWSSSCFEHLGSIEAGLLFFLEQMKCLRPGGIAVHTTEYNYLSNDKTLNDPNLVFFRQRDLLELEQRLAAQGDRLWPIDLVAGTAEADLYVDQGPYKMEPHLNLSLAGFTFTSVLLVATRSF